MTTPSDLFFIDIETTGLEPEHDHILEVSWIFSSPRYMALSPQPKTRVITPEPDTIDILKSTPYVLDMHTKNGLLEDLMHESTVPLAAVEREILVDIVNLANPKPTIAGSSVHFDKAFLAHHMPTLHEALSHRVHDVSTIKHLAESLDMAIDLGHEKETHRAEDDILWSFAYAREVRKTIGHDRKVLNTMKEAFNG